MDFDTKNALDIVGLMASSQRAQDVIELLRNFGESLGYGHFCLSDIPPSDAFTPHYFDYWPNGWGPYYLESGFHHVDPVLRALRSAVDPFNWSDVPKDPEGSPGARMMQVAREGWRMEEGFGVPIHSVTGAQALVSFVSDRPDPRMDGHPGLHLAAIFAHFRIEELSGRPTSPPAPDLSARERDMLSFAAAGRPNRAIAERLNLSDGEGRAILTRTSRKLGAKTRAQAIVHAHRAGLLAL